jgi:hypothetical protein
MKSMFDLFKLGDRLSGYCVGYFGREDYGDKTVVEVRTKYAVFEYDDGRATVLNINECENLSRDVVEMRSLNRE